MTALTAPAATGRPIPQSRRRPMWIVTDSITLGCNRIDQEHQMAAAAFLDEPHR